MMRKFLLKRFSDEYSKNIVFNYAFRLLSIVLGLFTTKLILGYLGVTLYGLWVTITSVISWMSSGDLGIGNGLRNELAKAYGEGDVEKQKKLISSAFITMVKIAGVLLVVIVVLSEIFFRTNILTEEVRIAMYITSVFFCLNLILGVSQSVALGYQKSWLTSLTTCETQVALILGVVIVDLIGISANLNFYAIVNGVCTTIPNIILILILKHNGINVITIDKNNIEPQIVKPIMNVGIQFFGIQLCGVILYSTDSLIINKLISSEMVTKYEVITKIYNTGNSLFSILLIAFWSGVTFHLAKNDIIWIKNKIKELLGIWAIYSVGVFIVSILFNWIIRIWLGSEAIEYEWQLIVLFGLYSSMTAFSAIFVNVLNGMGVIKLQFILAIIAAIINIPLSIFLARNMGMGIFGIKLATFISAALSAIVMPIQAMHEVNKRIQKGL